MPARPLKIAILGATGAVGGALLDLLEAGELPVSELRLLASERSREERVEHGEEELVVDVPDDKAFRGLDLALFAAPAEVARAWAPRARADGVPVVDLSPAFRADPDVPLVASDANPGAVSAFRAKGLVACPSAAAVTLSLVLGPIQRASGAERAVVTLLEPASAAGRRGTRQLEAEVLALLNGEEPDPSDFSHRMAFNVVPQVGSFGPGGLTEGEAALQPELRRILSAPELRVTATAVRVPLFHGVAATVNLRTTRRLGAGEARELLRKAPGVKVLDAPGERVYPMPMLAVHDEAALVGRIRDDPSAENALDLFAVGDNLRLGAARNALRIAALLRDQYLA
jgi:aspartate-semialdehyde dehydrogenase